MRWFIAGVAIGFLWLGWLINVPLERSPFATRSIELIAPAKGDTIYPRYYCQTDSILDCSGSGMIRVRRCGVSHIYMRLAMRGKFITGDSIITNACNLLPCDSAWKLLKVSADTTISPWAQTNCYAKP